MNDFQKKKTLIISSAVRCKQYHKCNNITVDGSKYKAFSQITRKTAKPKKGKEKRNKINDGKT